MDNRTLLEFMAVAEKLKCQVRHSWTSTGRRESVAEHTYRLCVFAWLVRREFPECDMDRVMEMCLFHDLGEAVHGDVPCFLKNAQDNEKEADVIEQIASILPEKEREELKELFSELEDNHTQEAKIVHALDKMEALIQHNEASIDTWLLLEYDLQMTYGQDQVKFSPYLQALRKMIERDSVDKISKAEKNTKQIESRNSDGFYISKDPEKIDKRRVVELLHQSEWAKERPESMIFKAMENSVSYGVFDKYDFMVGYARIITDHVTTFYLMDVIIDEKYRHQGLGTILMDAIMADVGDLWGILHTEDAQEFYARYGFKIKGFGQDQVMEKER